ncbi:phage holin family protein [Patescibacteria group bacterium]|nr:phage holin family protein [Patescibacteria group bacterium]
MRLIAKFIFHIFVNAVAILITNYFLPGFFSGDLKSLGLAALILTVINIILKPIIKLITGPIILLTFGLFTLVINAILIYVLDILSQAITIQGLEELIIATLIISFVNFLIGSSAKLEYKK